MACTDSTMETVEPVGVENKGRHKIEEISGGTLVGFDKGFYTFCGRYISYVFLLI